jgi:hypothetical protein
VAWLSLPFWVSLPRQVHHAYTTLDVVVPSFAGERAKHSNDSILPSARPAFSVLSGNDLFAISKSS